MGQALNAASAMDAYTLTDRGTWLSFTNKGSLVIAVEGDPRLINRYDVIELDPQKHAGAKLGLAKMFRGLAGVAGRAAGDRRVSGERGEIVQSVGGRAEVIAHTAARIHFRYKIGRGAEPGRVRRST